MQEAVERRHGQTAYAGLDFIKAAFCPLEFNAVPLRDHPRWAELRRDQGLAAIEISDPLHYPRQFPYTNPTGNRKTGTQIVTAPFGLAPKDFDLFLGIYTYLKRLPELPADGRSYLTVDFIARQLNLPADGQASYLRIRSRIFRFSYVKYTNSAFWNADAKSYDIVNFGFCNLASHVPHDGVPPPHRVSNGIRPCCEIMRDGNAPHVRLRPVSDTLPRDAAALSHRQSRRMEPA